MFLDIAPFSHRSHDDGADIFRWEEPRNVRRIELLYPTTDSLPTTGEIHLEYWQNNWPGSRPVEGDLQPGKAGRAAWKPQDDWFNGSWVIPDMKVARRGRRFVISFTPLAGREFPELRDYNVDFRRTLKLRLKAPHIEGGLPETRIHTDTEVEERRIDIELGCGMEPGHDKASQIAVYNGFLVGRQGPTEKDPRLHLTIVCSRPDIFSHDETIVTVRSPTGSFSFRPDDLLEVSPLWAPDLCVLVSTTDDDLVYSPHLVEGLGSSKCVYDRILEMPEQTLHNALKDNPPKRPMHFIVGIEGRRQKFGIEANGDLFAGIGFVRRVPGPDTEKVSWEGGRLYTRFNWDDMTPNGRFLDEGYLPIHRAIFSKGMLDIHQQVLATKLMGSINSTPIQGDDLVLAMVRITFVNMGDDALGVEQKLSCDMGDRLAFERIVYKDGLVYRGPGLRMAIDVAGKGEMSECEGGLIYKLRLPKGKSHSIIVKMPFADLLTPEEVQGVLGKSWDIEYRETKNYWKSRVAQGTEIHTGVGDIDDFHRALLTHILINDDHEIASERIIGRVSSFNYGNFSNEAIMQILELDRRGFHEEARRHLDTYIHYQGTVGLPGNFRGREGVFYGSGGYEAGEYNQHHGWVLFGLAEHFRYTGDEEWLRSIAHAMVEGCDWIVRERKATMAMDAEGRRSLEYGFLPAGAVEDVKEFCYWLSTNCLTYRGLAAAAEVLDGIGHPDGGRLLSEARNYREDLLAGIEESMIRSPLVRLRDGTYIPQIPSSLYWRGRAIGWIREVLEGSIIAVNTVVGPDDPRSTYVLKDFEDNRYLDAPYNYALDDFEAQWFSRGGFSMQPNLIYTLSPYLARDQVEHYLRTFFNAFAACWRPEIRCMTEHPLPTLADWTGDHFKSSDESMVAYSLRSMFVWESGPDLYLGRAIPRSWLSPGARIWIRSAKTYFGEVSLEVSVAQNAEKITAIIEGPTRDPPDRIILRLRHPKKARMKAAIVNGEAWKGIDGGKEWVIMPTPRERITVVAEYDVDL